MSNGIPAQREALGYLLKANINFEEFITFCKFGLRDAQGNYLIDPETGLQMRGVVNWLRGNQVFEGNFFIGPAPSSGMLVLVPQTSLTWLGIPGFKGFLRLPITICANQQNGVILGAGSTFLLNPRPDIDILLSGSRVAFEAVPEDRREELNRALRGEKETDLDAILRELGLFDVVNPV